MKTNILVGAVALSDRDLLARIEALAGAERETTAELVAHLAALELRPSLYLAQGYGSLFAYCTQALRLSEDAACNRIYAARACRQFPVILDLLASGDLSLTSIRKLQPHLTPENHERVLARAKNRSRGDIESLIVELAPQPDVSPTVRKLPATKATCPISPNGATSDVGTVPSLIDAPLDRWGLQAPPAALVPANRPIIQASAPERYRVQFTIDGETHAKLRRIQALLRREIPNGDPAAIYNRGLDLLLEKIEEAKLGGLSKPRPRTGKARPIGRAYEIRIRSGTDKNASEAKGAAGRHEGPSRHIPNAVKRAVWHRDQGQCAFVSAGGRRCIERSFLELHHIHPYALRGPATVGNISLRCRRHNQYEAELVFGPAGPVRVGETHEAYRCGSVMDRVTDGWRPVKVDGVP